MRSGYAWLGGCEQSHTRRQFRRIDAAGAEHIMALILLPDGQYRLAALT